MMLRKNGISTLLACQNEEATVGLSILSFLDFSDEIIVVDNGSTDASKDICRELERRYPEKVKFYDVPHLQHLHENRQYAFERSRFRWIVRADADFVCYTDGENDCRTLRRYILTGYHPPVPMVIALPQPNLHGDFWHTGSDEGDLSPEASLSVHIAGRRVRLRSSPMARIYRVVPGLRFERLGRWEGVRYPTLLRRWIRRIEWPHPVWMHVNVKSDLNHFLRTERTNWRELGDFERYPTLDVYIRTVICEKYGTHDLQTAIAHYMTERFLPLLVPYNAEAALPYPPLLSRVMMDYPVYRVTTNNGVRVREFLGLPTVEILCQMAKGAERRL